MRVHIIQQVLLVGGLATFLPAALAAQDKASSFACPLTLTVTDQPQTPNGWSGADARAEHAFKTLKVYNGDPGKEEFDLKPDGQSKQGKMVTLSWNLNGYRDMNLFVRCFYHGTDATINATVPKSVAKCSVTLGFSSNNEIQGKSVMKCQ